MADYSIDFHTRASQSSWNSSALCDAFLHSLADYIKNELDSHDTPITLDGVIDLAIRIDLRIQTRQGEKHQGGAQHTFPPRSRGGAAAANTSLHQQVEDREPMQLGRTSLSLEERERCPSLISDSFVGQQDTTSPTVQQKPELASSWGDPGELNCPVTSPKPETSVSRPSSPSRWPPHLGYLH